jgi:hypothetical protein
MPFPHDHAYKVKIEQLKIALDIELARTELLRRQLQEARSALDIELARAELRRRQLQEAREDAEHWRNMYGRPR